MWTVVLGCGQRVLSSPGQESTFHDVGSDARSTFEEKVGRLR